MTAKEYIQGLPNGDKSFKNKTEDECLQILINSHKRIRGHYVYGAKESFDKLNDTFGRLITEITKLD